MTDFTKEDLKEILACVCNIDGKVLSKIHSLLDDQCKHEQFIENLENYLISMRIEKETFIDHDKPNENCHFISGYISAVNDIASWILRND